MFTIIPAIDLLDGQVVRLTQGDYDQVTHFEFTPENLAQNYESHGAKRIHLVDLNGAKSGLLVNEAAIKAIRKTTSCTLELGGGIRSIETAKSLFDLGLDYLVLGSLLVQSFETAKDIVHHFPGRIIAGLDLKDNQIAIHGWTEKSTIPLNTLLQELSAWPLESIICTHIEKDGMMEGPNFEGLLELTRHTHHPIIASGGVSSLEDIQRLSGHYSEGITGCIVGKAVMSGVIPLNSLWPKA